MPSHNASTGIPCSGPAPPQTFHYGPHPDCPECGPDYASTGIPVCARCEYVEGDCVCRVADLESEVDYLRDLVRRAHQDRDAALREAVDLERRLRVESDPGVACGPRCAAVLAEAIRRHRDRWDGVSVFSMPPPGANEDLWASLPGEEHTDG